MVSLSLSLVGLTFQLGQALLPRPRVLSPRMGSPIPKVASQGSPSSPGSCCTSVTREEAGKISVLKPGTGERGTSPTRPLFQDQSFLPLQQQTVESSLCHLPLLASAVTPPATAHTCEHVQTHMCKHTDTQTCTHKHMWIYLYMHRHTNASMHTTVTHEHMCAQHAK